MTEDRVGLQHVFGSDNNLIYGIGRLRLSTFTQLPPADQSTLLKPCWAPLFLLGYKGSIESGRALTHVVPFYLLYLIQLVRHELKQKCIFTLSSWTPLNRRLRERSEASHTFCSFTSATSFQFMQWKHMKNTQTGQLTPSCGHTVNNNNKLGV